MLDQLIKTPQDVPTQVFEWGKIKWMVTPERGGSDRLSAGLVLLEPNKGHKSNAHEDSDELVYVIRGEGQQTIEGQSKKITSGDVVFIPAGKMHRTINTGEQPLKLLAVYTPPGPEMKLEQQAEPDIYPVGDEESDRRW